MEILAILKDTPIPTLLVLGGIALLILSIVTQIGGKVQVSTNRQSASAVLGFILLLLGVGLYLLPTVEPASEGTKTPVISGVTLREGKEKGQLVITQEIHFSDEDGNTNYVEWNLVNLSDPDQRQYINIVNGNVNAPLDEQKAGTYTIGTWYCEGHQYVATLDVSLMDRDGNRSEPYRYTLECK